MGHSLQQYFGHNNKSLYVLGRTIKMLETWKKIIDYKIEK